MISRSDAQAPRKHPLQRFFGRLSCGGVARQAKRSGHALCAQLGALQCPGLFGHAALLHKTRRRCGRKENGMPPGTFDVGRNLRCALYPRLLPGRRVLPLCGRKLRDGETLYALPGIGRNSRWQCEAAISKNLEASPRRCVSNSALQALELGAGCDKARRVQLKYWLVGVRRTKPRKESSGCVRNIKCVESAKRWANIE
jgi:hypothetical protein